MNVDAGTTSVRVRVPRDASFAELIFAPDADLETISPELCIAMLTEREVQITPQVRVAVERAIADATPGEEVRAVVARGKPPIHATNGWVEWTVDPEGTPPAPEASAAQGPDDEPDPEADDDDGGRDPVDYRDHSPFVTVEAGQTLGVLHPPRPGDDGWDVTGRVHAARVGKDARLALDDTIELRSDGTLVAQKGGVLSRSGSRAAIREVLEVHDYVDYSTGNIDFSGDVLVARGVRDLFTVRAQGNVQIRGLIEAATIDVAGDLEALGGMAGRDQGTMRVGGDLTARYLDTCRVTVYGLLRVKREIINCTLTAHNAIDAPSCAIIGGDTTPAGPVRVAAIGSPAQTPTHIRLGHVPALEPRLAEFDHLIQRLSQERERAAHELARLAQPGRKLTAPERERKTELSFDIHTAETKMTQCRQAQRKIIEKIDRIRVVDVRAQRMIHAGVRLHCMGRIYTVQHDIKGPVRILRDRTNALVYRIADAPPRPLNAVAEIKAAA